MSLPQGGAHFYQSVICRLKTGCQPWLWLNDSVSARACNFPSSGLMAAFFTSSLSVNFWNPGRGQAHTNARQLIDEEGRGPADLHVRPSRDPAPSIPFLSGARYPETAQLALSAWGGKRWASFVSS